MFICKYCGKECATICEECGCEIKDYQKQKEKMQQEKVKKLSQIKEERDMEITNIANHLLNKLNAYHLDYSENCSVEFPSGHSTKSDYIEFMKIFRNLYTV